MRSNPGGRPGVSARAETPSPWIAVAVVLVGSYSAVLNNTVIGVALPAIATEVDSGGTTVDWVVTGFLIGVVLGLPGTAWLSDRLGPRVVYISSLSLFGVGAAFCTFAPSMNLLVAGRLVQGVGGGALMPVGMAIVYDLFPPHRRGSALGVWGVAVMAAPALGPPLGGLVVSATSWRWIFAGFVIVAAIAAALSIRWLPDLGRRDAGRLDLGGWILAAITVSVIVVGSRKVGDWGIASPTTVLLVALAVALFAVLVRRSLGRSNPIIDFRIFRVRSYGAAMFVGALLQLGQLAQLTFVPLELQVVRNLDAQHVGLLLAPAAVGTAAMMPIAGWLADRIGSRLPAIVGLCLSAASMWRLANLESYDSDGAIVMALVAQGVGLGLAFIPTQVSALNSLPGRFVGQATAMSNMTRQLGGAMGVAILSALLVTDLGTVAPRGPEVRTAQDAYNGVFLLTFWLVAGAIILSLVLPGKKQTQRHHVERAAEFAVGSGISASG